MLKHENRIDGKAAHPDVAKTGMSALCSPTLTEHSSKAQVLSQELARHSPKPAKDTKASKIKSRTPLPEFVEETSLYDVQITMQTAFPGTPLYHRLLTTDRLIEPYNWRKCTLFDANFYPLRMTREQLERRFYELAATLYSNDAVARRHRRFVEVYGPKWRSLSDLRGRVRLRKPHLCKLGGR